MTPEDLLGADVAYLRAGAARWAGLAADVDDLYESLSRATADLPHFWSSGPAADAAQDRVTELRARLGSAHQLIDTIARAWREFADDIDHNRKLLADLVYQAEHPGPVTLLLAGATGHTEPAGGADASAVMDILDRVNHADRGTALALSRCGAWDVDALPDDYAEEISSDLSWLRTESPAQQTMWWNRLNPVIQDELIKRHPEVIGSSGGIPVRARDAANRILVARDKNRVLAERAVLTASLVGIGIRAENGVPDPSDSEVQPRLDYLNWQLMKLSGPDMDYAVPSEYLIVYTPGDVLSAAVCIDHDGGALPFDR